MRITIFLLLSFLYFACNTGSNNSSSGSSDLTGFESTSIPGSNASFVFKGSKDKPSETGYVVNGKKNGTWLTYHDEGRIKTLSTYVDGQKTGPYMELSNRGQIEKQIEYQGDKLHGVSTTYKFGKPIKETPYVNGKIEGRYVEYNDKGDQVAKEVYFKDGKQHGSLKYFDENGKVTLEYEYKNGEKVSGGIKN